MRTSLKRLAAATVTGVAASALLASPAMAVKPAEPELGDGSILVMLTSDNGRVKAGYVQVMNNGNGTYNIYVEDTNEEGISTTARIDTGNGVGTDVATSTDSSGPQWAYSKPVRKWRLVWGSYATQWYLPR